MLNALSNICKVRQVVVHLHTIVNAHCTFESILLSTAHISSHFQTNLSRNFVFLKHALYTFYCTYPSELRTDPVRFKSNTIYISIKYLQIKYNYTALSILPNFVGGKITYTTSISSNKWSNVEKNIEKSKTTKI